VFSARTCFATLIAWAGCVAVMLAGFSGSMRDQVLDADFWPKAVDAVIVSNDEARDETAAAVAQLIVDNADLSRPVSAQSKLRLERALGKALSTDEVREIWKQAFAQTHEQLMERVEAPDTRGQPVVVDLEPTLKPLLQQDGLTARDRRLLRSVDSLKYEFIPGEGTSAVAQAIDGAEAFSAAMFVAGLVLFALAFMLADERLKLLTRLGAGLVLAGLVTALAWSAFVNTVALGVSDPGDKQLTRDVLEGGFADLDGYGWKMVLAGVLVLVVAVGLRVIVPRAGSLAGSGDAPLTPPPIAPAQPVTAATAVAPARPSPDAPTEVAAPPTDLGQASRDIFGE